MEAFPSSYIAPAHPLIVLSGLVPEGSNKDATSLEHNGPRIHSESPNFSGTYAQSLLSEFQKFEPPTEGSHVEKSSHAKPMYFRFKQCGRYYALPSRKTMSTATADPPLSPLTPTSPSTRPRSVLSPLSPGTPLYPDGIMTAIWTQKYQDVVPSLIISFFSLTFEQEYKTLNDNRMKNEIIAIKASLAQSYSRIRFMVVITSEKSIIEDPEIEERLHHIRRTTKLDNKTCLFFCGPNMSPVELSSFVADFLSDVRPTCLEFYREMVKHTRRKRDRRGTSAQLFSPIDESTKLLGKAGWTARDEFKLGFLSEFCLEIDASNRHYNTAWEALFGFGGVFDTVSSSSPRWHEHFQFASILAIRFVRCLLAAGMPSSAVRFWKRHQLQLLRLRENNPNSGDLTQADIIWTRSMAQLTREIPNVAMDLNARKTIESIAPNKRNVYAEIEKALANDEHLRPWERLHHTGYWMMYCASKIELALKTLDTEGSKMLTSNLEEAAAEFAGRGQARMSDRLKLKLAHELYISSNYDAAFKILKLLWQRNFWRLSGWWPQLGEVTFSLNQCAKELGDFEIQVSTLWELSSRIFKPFSALDYDIENLLRDSRNGGNSPSDLQIRQEDIESFVKIQFSFQSSECHAGEPVAAQLQISCLAHAKCKPITLSYIRINLEGNIGQIEIHHDAGTKRTSLRSSDVHISDIKLHADTQKNGMRSTSALSGECNLVCAPGQLLVLNMNFNNHEAGNISAIKALTGLSGHSYSVQYSADLRKNRNHAAQWFATTGASRTRPLQDANNLKILPKLPKATVTLSNIQPIYYVNETSSILVEVENSEEEPIDATLRIWLSETKGNNASLEWSDEDVAQMPLRKTTEITRSIGIIDPSRQAKASFEIQLPQEEINTSINAEVIYSFTQNPTAGLKATFSAEIQGSNPFETKYRLMPTLHPDPWPSYFSLCKTVPGVEKLESKVSANTNATRWILKTTLLLPVETDIVISRVGPEVMRTSKGCHYFFHTSEEAENNKPINPREYAFVLDVLEDEFDSAAVGPSLEAELMIKWHRKGSAANSHTSSLPIPQLNFPTQEPRVFAKQLTSLSADTLLLEVIIENPSAHYLSFDLALEPKDDFAFSGSIASTLHLVPFSRHSFKFNLLPFVSEAFIQPKVQVTDIYFNKVLPINPVGQLRIDQKGILLWAS